ncbi:MAG: hypothetical protein ACI4U3_05245 [Traorella sp.]
MLVKDFLEKSEFEYVTSPAALNKEISGVFVGDLLSWVMGNSEPNQVWITVQAHMNIVAVAALKEISCLVIAQSAEVEDAVLQKAIEEDITLCRCDLSAYEVCKKCIELGL